MESGGIDLAGTTSSTNTNRTRGERRSRSSSDEGSAGGFGSTLDQDEELARSLQQEDSNAASAIRAPIAPRHEMLLGDDYGDHSSSMFGGSSRMQMTRKSTNEAWRILVFHTLLVNTLPFFFLSFSNQRISSRSSSCSFSVFATRLFKSCQGCFP